MKDKDVKEVLKYIHKTKTKTKTKTNILFGVWSEDGIAMWAKAKKQFDKGDIV